MTLIMGDRATFSALGEEVDVLGIADKTVRGWFRENFRYVDADTINIVSYISKGSGNLTDIFKRKQGKYLGANDTSATVGYAPFTPTELIVKDLEAFTQSHRFKAQFPVSREDVKVMAYRNRNSLNLTVAMAMVDRFVEDEKDYFDAKERVEEAIVTEVGTMIEQRGYPITDFGIKLNALDVSGRGIDGCYLTVTGTSAENGDSGQVGRGNDPAGIIPLNRPMASEAAPGKNPVSHVGKIYNLLCFKMADRIYREVPGCDEVYTWLLSQIGKPINEPSVASVQLVASSVDARMFAATEEIVVDEFEHLDEFCRDLYEGVAPKVC